MAKKYAGSPLTTLSHHMDLLWLSEAYGKVRRDSAPGVDGQTVADYGGNLAANLQSLLTRAHQGTYRAPPVKRVHLPKSETETRPIGWPSQAQERWRPSGFPYTWSPDGTFLVINRYRTQ